MSALLSQSVNWGSVVRRIVVVRVKYVCATKERFVCVLRWLCGLVCSYTVGVVDAWCFARSVPPQPPASSRRIREHRTC